MKAIDIVLCPASVQHPRQTEAALLPFGDGRLLLAYTDYYDGRPKDKDPARIMGKWSADEGASWTPPFLLQENLGLNVMSVSLLGLPSGRVLLAFIRKDTPKDWTLMVKYSDDEGKTWSSPTPISTGAAACMANDRLVRLSSGRLLAPVETVGAAAGTALFVWISDDDGATWHRNKGTLEAPANKQYHEPVVVELSDGKLAMYIRTLIKDSRYQFIHIAHSADGGETWKLHSEGGPGSTFAPCLVKRVPDSTDLLLIWNNHMMRSSLTAAISRDDGETWKNFRLLEEEEDWPLSRSHTYPSLAFLNGNAHITYWESHKHPKTANMFHLVYRRLPLAWFYEDRPRRAPAYNPTRDLLSHKTEYDGELTENK